MGEQRNLTEENVEELSAQLEKMQETNPDLEYRFAEQIKDRATEEQSEEPQQQWLTLMDVYDKVLELDRKIDRIFGGYVLIDGQFKDITRKVG